MCVFRHFLTQVLVLCIPILSLAQTPVIASKHSGLDLNTSNINRLETFGAPTLRIDSFIRISKDEMVEVSTFYVQKRDTMKIKSHPMFKGRYNIDNLRKKHPHIAFVNFEKFEKIQGKKTRKEEKDEAGFILDFNHWYWYALLLVALFALLFNRFLLNFARQSTNYPIN